MQNIGYMQLLILLAIVVLVFGTKRLRNLGSDLGGAIKGFRKGLNDDDDESGQTRQLHDNQTDPLQNSTKASEQHQNSVEK